jgi:hypothetical protein
MRERIAGQLDRPPPDDRPPGSTLRRPNAEIGLGALHELFGHTLAADLVQSPSIDRAVRVLDDLEWIERNVHRRAGAGPAVKEHPDLEVVTTIALEDGVVRVVARLSPSPGPTWEQKLAAFEDSTYRADGDRPVLRHGTLVVAGTPSEVTSALARATERIRRFNVSLI